MLHILILGGSGMLGRAVQTQLASRGDCLVDVTQRVDPARPLYLDASNPVNLAAVLSHRPYACVINCVGILKALIDENDAASRENATRVNALFPHELARQAAGRKINIVHMSTDGVFSGHAATPYFENSAVDCVDLYGRTKAQGECPAAHVLNLRCSIIGRDPERKRGLVEWLLAVPPGGSVEGYEQDLWNGVTTLQFARLCETLVQPDRFHIVRAEAGIRHFCPNPTISKYELLCRLQKAARRPITVVRNSTRPAPISRILATHYTALLPGPIGAGDWGLLVAELVADC